MQELSRWIERESIRMSRRDVKIYTYRMNTSVYHLMKLLKLPLLIDCRYIARTISASSFEHHVLPHTEAAPHTTRISCIRQLIICDK